MSRAFTSSFAAPWLWAAGALVLSTSVFAGGVEDLLFRSTFDGSVDAEIAQGVAKPKAVSGSPRFEEGKYGQALVVGEAGAVVEYCIESNLDVKQGAISFWFRPVDWEPSEQRSHVFLQREFTTSARPGMQSIEVRETAGEPAPDMIRLSVTDPASGLEYFQDTVFLGESGALVVRCTPIPSRGICVVTVQENDPSVLEHQPEVEADLVKEGQREPLLRVAFGEMADGSASGRFDLSGLLPGHYELRTRVTSGGKLLDQSVDSFIKPEEPWRELQVGASDEVPPPWTPLRSELLAHHVVRIDCWNRSHFFDSPVPGAIRNGDTDHFHAMFPSLETEASDNEWITTRIQPGGPWIRKKQKLAFGVYGFVP